MLWSRELNRCSTGWKVSKWWPDLDARLFYLPVQCWLDEMVACIKAISLLLVSPNIQSITKKTGMWPTTKQHHSSASRKRWKSVKVLDYSRTPTGLVVEWEIPKATFQNLMESLLKKVDLMQRGTDFEMGCWTSTGQVSTFEESFLEEALSVIHT